MYTTFGTYYSFFRAGRVAQSVQRLATGWTVRGSNPGGGEIFRTCSDRPWGPPSLLYNGYLVFPGGKGRPGRDADLSPTSSAVVKKEQRYTSTTPMRRTALYRASVPVEGCTLLLFNSFYMTVCCPGSNPTRTTDSHLKRMVSTDCCTHTVVPPRDGPRYARNMQGLMKYILSCASNWCFFTQHK